MSKCTDCSLYQKSLVNCMPGCGNTKAEIMLVGEAPGAAEERRGLPFVGPAGDVLNKMLRAAGISRKEIFISNVLRCVGRGSRVRLMGGVTREIQYLVDEKYNGKVLSYDKTTGNLVPKRVIGWYRTPLAGRKIYKVYHEYRKGNSKGIVGAIFTEDHLILTARGWVKVSDLENKKDKVATGDVYPHISSDTYQIILGTLLGDGQIRSCSAVLSFTHQLKQKEYAEYKQRSLLNFSSRGKFISVTTDGVSRKSYCVRTLAYRGFGYLRSQFYPEGKKIVPRDLINSILDERGVAIWVMDDGYVNVSQQHNKEERKRLRANGKTTMSLRLVLSTQSFNHEDIEFLIGWLCKKGYDCTVERDQAGEKIKLYKSSTVKLLRKIAKYFPPCMRYKLPPDIERSYPFDPDFYEPRSSTTLWAPVYKKEIKTNNRTMFCLDVEDTHNFVTLGGIVHNCRPPNNQLPDSKKELKEMLVTCFPYLKQEILDIKPKVVVPMGNVALLSLTGREGITKKRGEILYNDELGTTIIPTIHPAAVLRNPHYEEMVVNDFKRVKAFVEGKDIRAPVKYVIIKDREMADALFKRLSEVDYFVFDIESDDLNLDSPLLGIGFCWKEQTGVYLPLVGQYLEDFWGKDYDWVIKNLKQVLKNDAKKIAHNGKFDIKLLTKNGFTVKNFCFDTMLAHYLTITEIRGTHGLKSLAWMYTDMGGYDKLLGNYPWKEEGFRCIPISVLGDYCCADVDVTFRLCHIFSKAIKKEKMKYLFKILVTASKALAFMEVNGVKVDITYLKKLEQDFTKEIQSLGKKMRKAGNVEKIENEAWEIKKNEACVKYNKSKTIQKRCSEAEYVEKVQKELFNFRSTKQLRKLLFEEMKLPIVKRTKTGGSTDEETLTTLARRGKYPIIDLLLKYRKVNKMLSTYVKGFIPLVDSNDRVHTTYLLHGTTTGRLSSNAPNLQNIPRDSIIKNVFIASEGRKLVEADFAQAEFRCWAHLSQDSKMIKDIKSGVDIHKKTAATVYSVPLDEVTKVQRQVAKGVVFGLMYGRGVDSIAEEFNISKIRAQKIINTFFSSYPKARQWLTRTKVFARERGYVVNVFGRKRRLPDLQSNRPEIIASAERMAINAPIQSTASDLTLISLVRMMSRIKKQKKKTNIVLTVHDSIVFDAPKDEIEWVVKNVVDVMENPTVDLLVPMTSEIKIGDRWGDLKEVDIGKILER